MSWQKEIEELARRRELMRRMGGEEGIARQRRRGKLTVRERIDALADPGSFREFLSLMGHGVYDGEQLVAFTPKPSVDGMCRLGGRPVVVTAGDFTVRGGSAGGDASLGGELGANRRALEWRIPLVRLIDSAGGSVRSFEEIGRTYMPDGNVWTSIDVRLLRAVPVVSAVMGSAAGLPAVNACMAHWNLMVRGIGHVFPGGPPVVKAALGYDVTKEDLGGERIHVHESGVVDNLAETEEDAFAQIRRFLSYLPDNVWEAPPRLDNGDNPERREQSLLSAIPRDRRLGFDPRAILAAVLDIGSFFEIAPFYGQSRVTGLGRIGGYPVGVMINDPNHLGGATDVAAGEKAIRLIQLCDTFHLPLVSLADEPGVMVGLESERRGIERAGARLLCAVCDSSMPWCTVVMRRLYGVAGQSHHRTTGMFRRYAWPSARWGSMHIEGGASAAYRREIETAPDPAAKRREIESKLEALASPFRTAEATGQDIIDPRDTRPLLFEFVEDAQRVLRTQLGPIAFPYRP
jgi:acetyl-CoA carboxylase carboxyltransferase component